MPAFLLIGQRNFLRVRVDRKLTFFSVLGRHNPAFRAFEQPTDICDA